MDTEKSSYEYKIETLSSNLVDIKTLTDGFEIDLKYASEDNFIGKSIYPITLCAMQICTARKLVAANKELLQRGLRIKIWDAYRPLSVQKIMWDAMPVDGFVANPFKGGSIHNGGFAVDVTLVDMEGRELEMPTGFDDFSEKASRNSPAMSEAAAANLAILTDTMVRHGFKTINTEWWHYYDEDLKERIPLDIPLEKLKNVRTPLKTDACK